MRINNSHLCNIAHSPKFLEFISSLDRNLYLRFSKDLANITGCKLLGVVVSNLVADIDAIGSRDLLIDFLLKNHPSAVICDSLFKDYNPRLFTIPHKTIVNWPLDKVLEFAGSKFMCRYLNKDGLFYIEFLNFGEEKFSGCSWELPE